MLAIRKHLAKLEIPSNEQSTVSMGYTPTCSFCALIDLTMMSFKISCCVLTFVVFLVVLVCFLACMFGLVLHFLFVLLWLRFFTLAVGVFT